MMRSLLLGLLCAAILAHVPVQGCGGNPMIPPSSFCGPLENAVLGMPEPYFSREVRRLLGLPEEPKVIPGEREHYGMSYEPEQAPQQSSPWQRTMDADARDLEQALNAKDLDSSQTAELIASYRKIRTSVEGQYGESESSFTLDPIEASRTQLPPEFLLYVQGAAAYHNEDTSAALQSWRSLLKLPARERKFRSTWAAYMIGKALLESEPELSIKAFEQCRQLAAEGYADTLGLAPSSWGWQAKLELEAGNAAAALRHYVEQARLPLATGTDYVSLQRACGKIVADPKLRIELIKDPQCRPVLTAYILSCGMWADGAWYDPSDEEKGRERLSVTQWLGAVEAAGIKLSPPEAEDLAWLAYNQGNMELTKRWLALASERQPIGRWLAAKLMLREGQIDPAIAELEALRKVFSPDEIWGITGESVLEPQAPYRAVCAELGAIYLGQEKFMQALSAYVASGRWEDISYLAERVVTTSELEQFMFSHMQDPAMTAENISHFSRGTIGRELTYLLARRLMREGQPERARPYFLQLSMTVNEFTPGYEQSPKTFELMDLFNQLVKKEQAGEAPNLGQRERAQNLFDAAKLTREYGMEFMGTELAPDWTISAGMYYGMDPVEFRILGHKSEYYDDPNPNLSGPVSPLLSSMLVAQPAEKKRVLQSAATPNQRFHYRLRAADMLWRSALMLPRNDTLEAQALWYAWHYGSRDPAAQSRAYKAFVLRNPKLPAGQQAAKHGVLPENPPPAAPKSAQALRLFVNAETGDDENDGRSWKTAKRTIDVTADVATDTARAGGKAEIWVARGIYRERLTLRSNVWIFGGFKGDETSLTQRLLSLTDYSRIDGSQADGGRPVDHVVIADNITSATLDGFAIQGGRADGVDLQSNGGGLYCENIGPSVEFANCLITGNQANLQGGGFYCRQASPRLTHCSIVGNLAADSGGGLACDRNSSPTLEHCTIVDNSASYGKGAGVFCEHSDPRLDASRIAGNWTGGGSGGGFYLQASSPRLTNCLLAGNSAAEYGGAMSVSLDSYPQLAFCTVADNAASRYAGGLAIDSASWEGATTSITVAFRNCIFSGNNRSVLSGGLLRPASCLFSDNPDGIYPAPAGDTVSTGSWPVYRTASEINLKLDGASGNVGGEVRYVMQGSDATTGHWSAAPVYDRQTNTTRLVNRWAWFGRKFQSGDLIQPNTKRRTLACVVGMPDRKTILVAGDLTRRVHKGDQYRLVDYRLQNGSSAIKQAMALPGIATDMLDQARPQNQADVGAYQAPARYQRRPDTEPPESHALPLPPLVRDAMLEIPFEYRDRMSDAKQVRLFYQRDGGTWTLAGETTATAPFRFDFSRLPDGHYSFYTTAIDAVGNAEQPPKQPDAKAIRLTQFKGARIYVRPDAMGLGQNWHGAMDSVESAIEAARAFGIHEIWVARGHYSAQFLMADGLAIYGGFSGKEQELAQRDLSAGATILDASQALGGQPGRHVAKLLKIQGARLDGLTLTGGQARPGAEYEDRNGGGIFCKEVTASTITLCTISGNQAESGGGIYSDDSNVSISRCRIEKNQANNSGGGVQIEGDGKLINCIIAENRVKEWAGGGVYLIPSQHKTPLIMNCTFDGNQAKQGGAVAMLQPEPVPVINCIFSNSDGFALENPPAYLNGNATHLGCLFFHNQPRNLHGRFIQQDGSHQYRMVEVTTDTVQATLNAIGDPLYVDAAHGDYRLRPGSPAIDAGVDASKLTDAMIADDFLGTKRPQDGDGKGAGSTGDGSDWDIGAYEFKSPGH